MADPIISNTYRGDGSTVLFSFTFPYISQEDIRVSVDEVLTTEYTFANVTTIEFDSAPANGAAIEIYRDTQVNTIENVFYPGSAIRAKDLNDNFTQSLYVIQEADLTVGDANQNSEEALETANEALEKSEQALQESGEAKEDAAQAAEDAAQAAQDAEDAKEAAEKAEQAAQDAGDVGLLFDADPGDGSATSGSNKVPIKMEQGLKLPTQSASYAENNAIRINTANEKLEVRIDGDWTTASAGAEVSASPPSPATQGDVWWDPSDGRGYVYYTDADSSQWVEMNPSWNGSIADGVVTPAKLSPGGPNWDTSGNLTAAGSVSAGGGITDTAGAEIGSGYSFVRNDDNKAATFGVLNGGSSSTDFTFSVSGAGNVRIGGSIPADPNIELNADGSITAASTIRSSNGSNQVYLAPSGIAGGSTSADTFTINSGDGSITTDGNITAGNYGNNDAGTRIFGTYGIYMDVPSTAGGQVFQVRSTSGGTTTNTFGIRADGSITADGSLAFGKRPSGGHYGGFDTNGSLGLYNDATNTIYLNADNGQSIFVGVTATAMAGSGTRPVYADSSGGLTISNSDRNLKNNIKTLPSQTDRVKALNPVSFNWKDEARLGSGLEIGFIAQEVQEVVPEVVRACDEGTLSLDYPKLTATLTSALQEALTRIEALEARINQLEANK